MKVLQNLFILTLLANTSLLPAQAKKSGKVCFVTTIDIQQATKDGIYLNGYVVNIPYNKLVKLKGEKVRISGKVTIERGLNHFNDGVIRQGREGDTKHILKPKIKIIDD